MIYNKSYWENFDGEVTKNPSSFALFCRGFMTPNDTVLDLGCGNGRDALYFDHEGMFVTAIDIVDPGLSIPFVKYDLQEWKSCFGLDKTFDFVYCRFLLHAVPLEIERYVLRESWNVLNDGGLLCIETRSAKGKIPMDDHYRRLIDIDNLDLSGFDVIYSTEQRGLSVYNGEDPMLIRLICRKWITGDAGH